MYPQIELANQVYFLSFNDRRTNLFENNWPLPHGVSYNSYLIVDEKIAVVDTVEICQAENFLSRIKNIIGDREVDYLIINHMEPDHSGAMNMLIREYPNVTIVAHTKAFELIAAFDKPFKNSLKLFGRSTENVAANNDGFELSLGSRTLKFIAIPMVHWPETMVTYDTTNQILFSGDAFGSFGALSGGVFDDEMNLDIYDTETRRYFSNVVGKYCAHTARALKKIKEHQVQPKLIGATHGPVWRSNISWIMERYQKWSSYTTEKGVVIVFGSMYGFTEQMADIMARELCVQGIKNISMFDASKTHPSYIISEIFKYKGVMIGSSVYNNGLVPAIETLVSELTSLAIKERVFGFFGSYGWSGGGVKHLQQFADTIGWEVVGDSFEQNGVVKSDSYQQCISLAQAMAQKLHTAAY